jgi:hypothetical protein
MLSKRNLFSLIGSGAGIIAVGALVGCASNTSTGTAVPTLAQAQSWVTVLNTELPVLVQESINSGLVKTSTALSNAVTGFTTLANQFTSPSFSLASASSVLANISTALTTVLSLIPATAPYVPAVPSSTSLAAMHKATITYKK